MTPRLQRRPLPGRLDPADRHAVRAWLLDAVHDEVLLHGGPLPRLLRLTDDAVESLDLDQIVRGDPDFHPGATVDLLSRGARQVLLVARLEAAAGARALVFHAASDGDVTWWAATLPYATDTTTGLAVPREGWSTTAEVRCPTELPPGLRMWVEPAGVGRPARFAPPDPLAEVCAAFGSLPTTAAVPTCARTLTHLAAALTLEDLLHGRIRGAVIVRLAGRQWESWVVGEDLPVTLDDAIRAIASHGTPADAVALLHLAVFDGAERPLPGLQCVAQHGAERLESWSLLHLPDGPGGPLALAGRERWRQLPPAAGGGWLRPPESPVDLIALDAADA